MTTKKRFSAIRTVGGKILLIFISLSLVGVGALVVLTTTRSSRSLSELTTRQLEAIRTIKKDQIERLFRQLEAETELISRSGDVSSALDDLVRYHEEMQLRADGLYDTTGDGEELTWSYEEIYRRAYQQLSILTDTSGHHDVYLLCYPHGHVMYSNRRGADLGANLSSGQYRDSGLAQAWQLARETDEAVIVDMTPYAPQDNEPAMFIAQRVKRSDGTISGIAVIQVSLEMINEIMHERTGMGATGETYLVGEDLLMRSDSFSQPDIRSVGASLNGTVSANGMDTEAVRDAFAHRSDTQVIQNQDGTAVLASWDLIDLGDFEWAIVAQMDKYEVDEPTRQLILFVLYVAIGLIIMVVTVLALFSRSISRPLANAAGIAERIAEGDLTAEVPRRRSQDEISRLADSFRTMVESLNGVLGQVDDAVDQVNSGAQQVAQASQSLSQGSAEQASSLEEISASLNEINSQSNQNAESSTEASAVAKGALESAQKGNDQMQTLVSAMGRINESSDEITKVVKVIDDIAFQINLLALNANVEAARAGKYGKGFAVVAEEVRNLAVRSAEAAKETTQMVETTIRNIQEGNQSAQATSEQLEDIVTGAGKVADFLEAIALASKEQAQGVEQINQGLSQIDQVTQSNTANAEQGAAAAEQLSAQAQQLRRLVSTFKLARAKSDARDQATPEHFRLAHEVISAKDGDGDTELVAQPTGAASRRSPGVATIDPREAVKLDDDDFGKF
jgi:methyl-accepting chemotaxis protein